ncbi:hypothetical protein [Bradyrhizobium valentinum]|uniref:Formate dehydrogenase n=1 Tax=Bradyrhizobium valentinum TaxID=1518501 RepID=A0A0R3L962_9BRAD|nr:hypothetical protein [Bradyrhizobium valentinum]KRR03363.1 hypothetical protein CP49_10045 [Bradyrhizobium valentinum]KRR04473.1 hypothetical protein CQ10_17320 [Bradyrhizobium valentinum]
MTLLTQDFLMSEHKATIGRRQLLRTGIIGFIATATSTLGSRGVAADTEAKDDKRRARFQVNAAEVQTFYRVNRYPKH